MLSKSTWTSDTVDCSAPLESYVADVKVAGPIFVPKSVMISPGATAPVAKLAPFVTARSPAALASD